MTTQTDIQAQLPLTEAVLFILLSLAPEPKHGYAILKDVQALSKDRVVLSTGTLYGALKRLLEQGWIERVEDVSDAAEESGRPRKAYALTDLGRRMLDAEVARLRSLVVVAQSRFVEEPA
jgi:DNA-binding PadR family transcriptional regulator